MVLWVTFRVTSLVLVFVWNKLLLYLPLRAIKKFSIIFKLSSSAVCAPLKQITCPGLPWRLSSLRQGKHLKCEPSLFAVIRPNTTLQLILVLSVYLQSVIAQWWWWYWWVIMVNSPMPGNLKNDDATKWVPTGVESFAQKSSRKLREINKTFNSNLK